MVFKTVLIISCLVVLAQVSCAQTTIRGQVQSDKNQESLPFANVFLSGTTKGTVTDENGLFTLTNAHLLDTVRSTALQPVVAFTDLIHVIYTKEKESFDYQRRHRLSPCGNNDAFQKTLIRMLEPSATVEASGQFWPPRSIRGQGYWAWELMADDLPFDYNPEESITTSK
jgi:hypothetical protein